MLSQREKDKLLIELKRPITDRDIAEFMHEKRETRRFGLQIGKGITDRVEQDKILDQMEHRDQEKIARESGQSVTNAVDKTGLPEQGKNLTDARRIKAEKTAMREKEEINAMKERAIASDRAVGRLPEKAFPKGKVITNAANQPVVSKIFSEFVDKSQWKDKWDDMPRNYYYPKVGTGVEHIKCSTPEEKKARKAQTGAEIRAHKAAFIKAVQSSTVKEEVPQSFLDKLPPSEREYYEGIMKEHPEYKYLTPQNRELLRVSYSPVNSQTIHLINEVPHYIPHAVHISSAYIMDITKYDPQFRKVLPLTQRQIGLELGAIAENERRFAKYKTIDIMPVWEDLGETQEEFESNKIIAEQKSNFDLSRPASRSVWAARCKKALGGRPPTTEEVEKFMSEYEKWGMGEMREKFEEEGREGYKSSFVDPATQITDTQVHWGMFYCLVAYLLYEYGFKFIFACLTMPVYYIVRYIYKAYVRAMKPFVEDPRSKYSIPKQKAHWNHDRMWLRRFGLGRFLAIDEENDTHKTNKNTHK